MNLAAKVCNRGHEIHQIEVYQTTVAENAPSLETDQIFAQVMMYHEAVDLCQK